MSTQVFTMGPTVTLNAPGWVSAVSCTGSASGSSQNFTFHYKPPICECHSQNMIWTNDRSKKGGGCWRCKTKRRISQARYNAKRYEDDQIYRTTDVIRRRRKHREEAIERGESLLSDLKSKRGVT